MNTGPVPQVDEDAMRQHMQDGQNTKYGRLFASAFAQEHDCMAIHGVFLPNQTRVDNARIHQRLYDDRTTSVAGKYGEVEVRLEVFEIRFLTPEVAVVYVRGAFLPKGQPEKKAENIMTAVMMKREDRWEIVSFHNVPVQKQLEEEAGFVIRIEGVHARGEEVSR